MKGAQFLVPALLKTAVAPPLICYILLRYPPVHLPLPVRLILYLISWPVLFIIRSRISLHRSTVAARQAGAQPIPRVKGKWPLNLDVLVDWGKSGSEEEVGRMMVLLSRRYGVTYNTRVLGEDQVSYPNWRTPSRTGGLGVQRGMWCALRAGKQPES